MKDSFAGWSESSGGQFLRLDQVDLLPKLAERNSARRCASHPMEIPLWDGAYLYALVLGCLAAEGVGIEEAVWAGVARLRRNPEKDI